MKTINLKPYDARLRVFTNPSELIDYSWKNYKINLESNIRGCLGFATHAESPGGAIEFLTLLSPNWVEATVYHEALHLTHFIFDLYGVPSGSENTEGQAYFQGYIVEEIKKRLYPTLKEVKNGKGN